MGGQLSALAGSSAGSGACPCSESISDDGTTMILPLLNAVCSWLGLGSPLPSWRGTVGVGGMLGQVESLVEGSRLSMAV